MPDVQVGLNSQSSAGLGQSRMIANIAGKNNINETRKFTFLIHLPDRDAWYYLAQNQRLV